MPIPALIANILGGKAADMITSLGGVVDKFVTTKAEKEAAALEVTKVVNQHLEAMETEITKRMESEDKAVSERWTSDMASDSWLSKNTRPLVMLSLLAFLFFIVITDSIGRLPFEVNPKYIDLMGSLLDIVVVAYFGSRGVEKFKAMHESGKTNRS